MITGIDVEVSAISHELLKKQPEILRQLSKVYCNTWMYDPNFAEYRICRQCNRYYSQDDVVRKGITTCDYNHKVALLDVAWEPKGVESDILAMSLTQRFYGCIAAGIELTEIAGFAWVYEIRSEDIIERWGRDFYNTLASYSPDNKYMYFDSLATIPEVQGRGVGTALANQVCEWVNQNSPKHGIFLRTHKNSPAVSIYKKLGFEVIAKDTEHGDGRIMMSVKRCSDILI